MNVTGDETISDRWRVSRSKFPIDFGYGLWTVVALHQQQRGVPEAFIGSDLALHLLILNTSTLGISDQRSLGAFSSYIVL